MTVDLKDPLLELQRAMVQALQTDASLTSLGVTVFDRVSSEAFPFITVGEDRLNPDDTFCQTMSEVYSTVRVYTQSVGKVQAKTIAGKVRWLLDKDHGAMNLNGFKIMAGHCTNIAIRDHEDGITVQAELNFNYVIVPDLASGNLIRTLEGLVTASVGELTPGGYLTATLGPVLVTGNGSLAEQSTLIVTLEDLSVSGSGALQPQTAGALASTLGDLTVSGSGSLQGITAGNLTSMLDDITSTTSTRFGIFSTLFSTLADVTSSGFGVSGAGANLNITLDDVTSSGSGAIVVSGDLSSTLEDLSLSATSTLINTGSFVGALTTLTLAGAGALHITGDLTSNLDALVSNSTASVAIAGQTSSTLEDLTVSASGAAQVETTGSLTSTLAELLSSTASSLTISGSLASTLDVVSLTGSATITNPVAGNEAETDALIAQMSVAPSTAREANINTLIKGLKDDGIWTKLDFLYMTLSHHEQAARLNWKDPANDVATISGGTFIVDGGNDAAGGNPINSPIQYQDTNMSGGDSHFGVWYGSLQNPSDNQDTAGFGPDRELRRFGGAVYSRWSGGFLNSGAAGGLNERVIESHISGTRSLYVDGSSVDSDTDGPLTPAATDTLDYGDSQVNYACHGGVGLTGAEVSLLDGHLTTYQTNIAAE